MAKKEPNSVADAFDTTTDHFVAAAVASNATVTAPVEASLQDQYALFVPSAGATFSDVSLTLPPDAAAATAAKGKLVKLPEGYTAVLTSPVSAEGIPTRIRCEFDGSEMVLIPAGVFRQGTDQGPADCGPAHPAYLSAYYIDVNEVTLAQLAKYQERQRSLKRGLLSAPSNASDAPERPALGLSFADAEVYARHVGKELPTEAEWEKAARGPGSFNYPWGEGRVAWNAPRVPGQIDAVGSFPSDISPYGVLDMAGNAREWCTDWYAADAYANAREKDGSPIRDWKGPARAASVGMKVVKGGTDGWELWRRNSVNMRDRLPDVGFRCVLRIPAGAFPESPLTTAEPADTTAPPGRQSPAPPANRPTGF
jgi:formylglycine-generating enzyme required for sulfatase activity